MRYNSLFTRLVTITLGSVIIVSISIAILSSNMAEQILLDRLIQSSSTQLELVQLDLMDYNDTIIYSLSMINRSDAFKAYITQSPDSIYEELDLISKLGHYIDLYENFLTPESTYLIVAGVGEMKSKIYSNNIDIKDVFDYDQLQKAMMVDGTIKNQILYHNAPLFNNAPYPHYIFATKPLVATISKEIYGYGIIVIAQQNLYKIYSKFLSSGVEISIIASDDSIYSSSKTDTIGTSNPTLLNYAQQAATSHNYVYQQKNVKKTYISRYLPIFDAYLVKEIDQKKAFGPLYQLTNKILKLVMIVLVIVVCLIYFLSRWVTKPLTTLISTIKSSRGSSLKYHPIDASSSYETQLLTDTYNQLIGEVEAQMTYIVEEQTLRRKADLVALQMQINPHFLYNTLSTIKYLSKDPHIQHQVVDGTIDSLIHILQHTIGTVDDQITIQEEIESLKHYVYINQIRFGDTIMVEYHISPDCYSLYIPKFIIQPFVENAFFHAFIGRESGIIQLFIHRQPKQLVIEIMDNGIGMTIEEKASASKRKHLTGIGINNVDERIKLMYGEDYGIDITSEKMMGTQVVIHLPII